MPTLPTLNLLLTRRFYSKVELFTAVCKYLSWSSASDCQSSVQIAWFFDNIMTWSYCLHRRYSMSQQKNSILINEHALNREPVPFGINSLPNLTSFVVLTIVPYCFPFVCLFLWYVIYRTLELSFEILNGVLINDDSWKTKIESCINRPFFNCGLSTLAFEWMWG